MSSVIGAMCQDKSNLRRGSGRRPADASTSPPTIDRSSSGRQPGAATGASASTKGGKSDRTGYTRTVVDAVTAVVPRGVGNGRARRERGQTHSTRRRAACPSRSRSDRPAPPSVPAGDAVRGATAGMTASEIRALFAVASRPEVVSLAGGMPNLAALPLDTLAGEVAELVARDGRWRCSTAPRRACPRCASRSAR